MDNVYVVIENTSNRVTGVYEDNQEACEVVDELNKLSHFSYSMYSVDFYEKD